MLKIDACALGAPPPISIGPTVDLIRRASVLTDVPTWLIRWSGERRHSALRRVVQSVSLKRGAEITGVARVFEADVDWIRKGVKEIHELIATGEAEDLALLAKYLERKEPMSNEPADLLASMSPAQKAVLREQNEDFGWFMPALAERLNLDIAEVRIACRANREIGVFRYTVCANEDDGRPHGSAYLRTQLGSRVLDILENMETLKVPENG